MFSGIVGPLKDLLIVGNSSYLILDKGETERYAVIFKNRELFFKYRYFWRLIRLLNF